MKEFKLLFILILKFAMFLILFGIGYNYYLSYYNNTLQTCDPYTNWISNLTVGLSNFFDLGVESHKIDPYHHTFLAKDKKVFAIVNEGCNSISVMILFTAFIFAFSRKWLNTSLYIIFGIIVLHFSNIARISFLTYVNICHESYLKIVHDYVFPAIIYGIVVLLWISWVKFFLINKQKPNE